MCVYVALPVIGIFGVCSRDFLRFTSLVRGIVRSLLVLNTFVLGGGGGSVTIGQCISICMGDRERYSVCLVFLDGADHPILCI